MEQEVTLLEMLEAREARASRQREILDSLGCPVVSFTMNIPGPVKNGPTIRRAFREGLLRLDAALETAGLSTLSREEIDRPTAVRPCGPSGGSGGKSRSCVPPLRTGILWAGCLIWMCWTRSGAGGAGRIWACPPGAVWSAAEWERAAPPPGPTPWRSCGRGQGPSCGTFLPGRTGTLWPDRPPAP